MSLFLSSVADGTGAAAVPRRGSPQLRKTNIHRFVGICVSAKQRVHLTITLTSLSAKHTPPTANDSCTLPAEMGFVFQLATSTVWHKPPLHHLLAQHFITKAHPTNHQPPPAHSFKTCYCILQQTPNSNPFLDPLLKLTQPLDQFENAVAYPSHRPPQ